MNKIIDRFRTALISTEMKTAKEKFISVFHGIQMEYFLQIAEIWINYWFYLVGFMACQPLLISKPGWAKNPSVLHPDMGK